jgi:hypothetical protein
MWIERDPDDHNIVYAQLNEEMFMTDTRRAEETGKPTWKVSTKSSTSNGWVPYSNSLIEKRLNDFLRSRRVLVTCSSNPNAEIRRFPRYRHPLISKPLSEIKPRNVRWLWPSRIPRGKLTIALGEAGVGKSLLMAYLLASESTGSALAPENNTGEARWAVLLSFEDDPEDTIRPRVDAAGANVNLIRFIHRTIKKDGKEAAFQVPRDLRLLEREIKTLGARLVVIDPRHSRSIWKHLWTLPRQLHALADSLERAAEALRGRGRPDYDKAVKRLIRYVKQTTGRYHDEEVSALIAFRTRRDDYSAETLRVWRHEHLPLKRSTKT